MQTSAPPQAYLSLFNIKIKEYQQQQQLLQLSVCFWVHLVVILPIYDQTQASKQEFEVLSGFTWAALYAGWRGRLIATRRSIQ